MTQITVDLPEWLLVALKEKARRSVTSESELLIRGLKLLLLLEGDANFEQVVEQAIAERLEAIEQRLMRSIARQIPPAIAMETEANSQASASQVWESQAPHVGEIPPTVRQLCVGDLVQIRDANSAHYMEVVSILEVGLIRAAVATSSGKQSFLKRDLRFVGEPKAGV